MTGADGTYDYKAMAAGIVLAGGEGMGNLLPVVEKELLHYRILDAMMREGFLLLAGVPGRHESAPVPRVPKVQRGP
mgnify:CR=1 FL=1